MTIHISVIKRFTLFLRAVLALTILNAGTLANAQSSENESSSNLTIPFAPYDNDYRSKMDFAKIERDYPLSVQDRFSILPHHLKDLDQEQVDQIYARLTAGPIPDGFFDGTFFQPKHREQRVEVAMQLLQELVTPEERNLFEVLKNVWAGVWKGKKFDRDHRILRNRLNLQHVKTAPSLFGEKFRESLLELPEETLLFPAKIYCGQSRLDSRRESIIIDYAYSEDLPGYRERVDYLAGRNGLKIRDEIRMVRPGFYLGRAYMGKFFVFNFTLYNDNIAKPLEKKFKTDKTLRRSDWSLKEDCKTGVQRIAQAGS